MRKTKGGLFTVYDANRKEVFVGGEQFKETMEFVVLACNTHEVLMDELIKLKVPDESRS